MYSRQPLVQAGLQDLISFGYSGFNSKKTWVYGPGLTSEHGCVQESVLALTSSTTSCCFGICVGDRK